MPLLNAKDAANALVGDTVPMECFSATAVRVRVPVYSYSVQGRALEYVPIRSRAQILSESSGPLKREMREFERTDEGWERIK